MIVLAKEIMIETLLEEIHTETGTTEDEGEVAVTAGVGVEVGVKRGFVTGIGIEAGPEAGAEHEAGVNHRRKFSLVFSYWENTSYLRAIKLVLIICHLCFKTLKTVKVFISDVCNCKTMSFPRCIIFLTMCIQQEIL